jgi:hypothetical protein
MLRQLQFTSLPCCVSMPCYSPGGDPNALAAAGGGVPQPCPGASAGVTNSDQLWTEGEGAIAVEECGE